MAKNQWMLVTGASSGIGEEIAKQAADDGWNLILVARRKQKLKMLAKKLKGKNVEVEVIVKDLSENGAAEELVKEIDDLGVEVYALVNNAGFATHGRFTDIDLDDQRNMMQLNMTALTELCQLYLKEWKKTNAPKKVLNVASTAAFQPGPYMATYYASKAYVLYLSEALAEEMKGTGITVTALCPGATRTEFEKRAGVEHTPLFKGKTMTAKRVARIGYRGMMRGKRVVVPGWKNWILAFLVRFTPRSWTTFVTGRLQLPKK